MRSYGLSASASSERRGSPHSDTFNNTDRLSPSRSNSMERNGGICLPAWGGPVRNEDSGAPFQTPSTRNSLCQTRVDKLENDSEAESGYSSYADYLKAYSGKSPYLNRILNQVNKSMPPPAPCYANREAEFTILDLSSDEKSRALVLSRRDCMSETGIVANLHQPPANVAVQILLWNTKYYLSKYAIDTLGLGLKLDPRFFRALYPAETDQNRRHWDPKYVTIAGAVVTIIRLPSSDKADAVPIVLIACMEWEAELANAVEEEIGDTYPFQLSAAETFPVYAPPDMIKSHEHANYIRLLNWCLKNEEEPLAGLKDMLLKPLFPLMYLDIFRIRNFCEVLRHKYELLLEFANYELHYATGEKWNKIHSDMPNDRLRLRAMVEDSEDGLNHLLRYIRFQRCADWPLNESWLRVENDLRATHEEARRFETQLRDYLQIKVGQWALHESQKSIELSNRQIEEGKRGQSYSCLQVLETID